MINIAICDDDKDIINILSRHIKEYSLKKKHKVSISTYVSPKKFLSKKRDLDLIFLDIEMEETNGIDVAKKIREWDKDVPIVYVTSHTDFWKNAYSVHAFDFIPKPFNQEDIFQTLEDFSEYYNVTKNSVMTFNSLDGQITVYLKDVMYLRVSEERRQVEVATKDTMYIHKGKISDWEYLCDYPQFYSPHRCCILNFEYFDKIINNFDIIMQNGIFLPLAQRKRTAFFSSLHTFIKTKRT